MKLLQNAWRAAWISAVLGLFALTNSAVGASADHDVPMGDVTYRIPAAYFQDNIVGSDHRPDSDTAALWSMWPEMEGRTAENWAKFNKPSTPVILLLMEWNPKFTRLQMDRWLRAAIATYPNSEQRFGMRYLKQIRFGVWQYPVDVYYRLETNGDITQGAVCQFWMSPKDRFPSPGCELYVLDDHRQLKFHIRESIFDQHDAIVSAWESFLAEHRAPTP